MKQHSSGFKKLVAFIKPNIREVTVEELKLMQANEPALILIDVREDDEWEQGHIEKAIHLSKGIIERDIENIIPDPQIPIVLYCGGGSRSALAAHNLQIMGYKNILSLAGGYRGWQDKQ